MRFLIAFTLIVLGLLLAALLLAGGALFLNRLPWSDPPGPMARLAYYLSGNVAEISDDAVLPELRARTYPVGAAELYRAAERSASALGWTVRARDPAGRRLEALVVTPLLHFSDDVSITVESLGDGGSRLLAHSASRVGRSDFGANTRHLLDLQSAVAQALADGV